MERILEPELMEDPEQALAFAQADFSLAHVRRVDLFRHCFPDLDLDGAVLDLGCGSGEVLLKFAREFPRAHFVGVDGSEVMLALARQRLNREPELEGRVRLIRGVIPHTSLPMLRWQLIMSHSLLHQLHRPEVLWQTVQVQAHSGTAVFMADLARPAGAADARRIVEKISGHEPPILQRDFFNSLCAAFEPAEVAAQLAQAGLALQIEPQFPSHLLVHGYARVVAPIDAGIPPVAG